MRRKLLASLGAALALCTWVGTAAADTGSTAAQTAVGPVAPSDPTLDAFGLVAQHVPEFGSVTEPAAPVDEPAAAAPEPAPAAEDGTSQANGSAAGSLAANGNETGQAVDQQQGGDNAYPAAVPALDHDSAKVLPTGGSTQVAGQSADSTQTADATANSTQIEPTNESASIRVLSPGDNGPVTQSNDSVALAGALNGNHTTQDLGQSQGGPGSGTRSLVSLRRTTSRRPRMRARSSSSRATRTSPCASSAPVTTATCRSRT